MKNLAEKTKAVTNALIDAYELRKQAGVAEARESVDEDGNDITLQLTGDIDENNYLKVRLEPLAKSGIYEDEVFDILQMLGKYCGFKPENDEVHEIIYKTKYPFVDVYKGENSWTKAIGKLRDYQPPFESDYSTKQGTANTKQDTDNNFDPITLEQIDNNNTWLFVRGHTPEKFTGIGSDLLRVFYYAEDRKQWRSYNDPKIQHVIEQRNTTSKVIGNTIKRMNKTAKNKFEIPVLIEDAGQSSGRKEALHYRWGP